LAPDDVVIVDLTPPELIERLRARRIYRPERV
jgi:K+-sensing histidine kinase KdpD